MDTRNPSGTVNLMPGPVKIAPEVHAAFCRSAISHRSVAFHAMMARTQARLRSLTGARYVTLLLGSGTLANDAVAAQLRAAGPGLVLENGHFGERLGDHARRAGLSFERLRADWGQPLPYEALGARLAAPDRPGWVWAVHHETSTGVLNDMPRLQTMTDAAGSKLCIDAISSIGTVPLDLGRAYLATGVSGKALAGYPGLTFVLHRDPCAPDPTLPRYLDIGRYAAHDGVPYTSSSNLLAALDEALDRFEGAERRTAIFECKRILRDWLRPRLEGLGYEILAPENISSPAVLSLVPPGGGSAWDLGERLDAAGIFLSYRSNYLLRRNLIQVCLFSDHEQGELEALLALLVGHGRR